MCLHGEGGITLFVGALWLLGVGACMVGVVVPFFYKQQHQPYIAFGLNE